MAQGYGPQGYGQSPHGYPPHHGYPPPQGYAPPPPKKGMSAAGIIGIVVLLGFGGCVGMCALGSRGAKEKRDEEKKAYDAQDALVVTAKEIAETYEGNEVAGDEKYKGKKLEVTGRVASIDSDIGDKPRITLVATLTRTVTATGLAKADAAKLKKGDDVTLVCKGAGEIIGSPRLEDCSVK